MDEMEEQEIVPPVTEPNLDDTGELDYEESENTPGSANEANSDDEDESAEISDHNATEVKRYEEEDDNIEGEQSLDEGAISDQVDHDQHEDEVENEAEEENDGEISEPEEGEVRDLEDGEVKDDSDNEADDDGGRTSEAAKIKKAGTVVKNRENMKRPMRPQITAPKTDGQQKEDTFATPCRFFSKGNCSWGAQCKFAHTQFGGTDKNRQQLDQPQPAGPPVPLMALKAELPQVTVRQTSASSNETPESAWERGLRQARELRRKADKKDDDFDSEPKKSDHHDASAGDVRSLMDVGRESRYSEGQSQFNEDYNDRYGNRNKEGGYEKRQQSPSVSMPRRSRDSVDDAYVKSHRESAQSRRPQSPYEREHGSERRDERVGIRDKQVYSRDYESASIDERLSQDPVAPLASTYRRQRHQMGDRDDRRRMEPEGWEYSKSPPASYYRERDMESSRRNYGDVDNRRPFHPHSGQQLMQQHHVQQPPPPQQQQLRPPNYHFLKTMHEQHQKRQVQNRVPAENNRDIPQMRGRHDYNRHYYEQRDRQQNSRQSAGGRQLPYERPASYAKQEKGDNQWRDPWRRSPDPGGRRNVPAGQGRRSRSGVDDRSRSQSPSEGMNFARKQRRISVSSSASGSSATSKSSTGSHDGRKRKRMVKEDVDYRMSGGPSKASAQQYGRGGSDSPDGHDRKRTKRSPMDRSSVNVGGKESGDVASRAAAKALGSNPGRRSISSFDEDAPRAYRQQSGGSVDQSSVGSVGSQPKKRPHTPSPPPDNSPSPASRPLSPPPMAPFFTTAPPMLGGKKMKYGHLQQRAEERKPIKMTIMSKNKLQTNAYGASDSDDDANGGPPPTTDNKKPSKELRSVSPVDSMKSGENSLDGAYMQQRSKTAGSDSGSGSGVGGGKVSRREELLRQLREVEHAIDAKKGKKK